MLRAGHIFGTEYLLVAQPPPVHSFEKAEYGGVCVWAVRYEQITVLGGANVAMSDHGKATDYDVLETDRVRIGDDAGEIRTRELARVQGPPYNRQLGVRPPAATVAGRPRDAEPASTPCCWREAARPLHG
jgi:hypothetical protein